MGIWGAWVDLVFVTGFALAFDVHAGAAVIADLHLVLIEHLITATLATRALALFEPFLDELPPSLAEFESFLVDHVVASIADKRIVYHQI